MEDQLYILRDGGQEESRILAHKLREAYGFNDEVAASGVGQHLMRELGRALAGFADALRERPLSTAQGSVVEQQAGVSQYSGKQVVEIVRDSAGKQTQAFQLGALTELLFHAPSFRDIA